MAMRMPRFHKPAGLPAESNAITDAQLRSLDCPASVIPFPGLSEEDIRTVPSRALPTRVQVRARRLSEHCRPEEERYEASFIANATSPVELLKSLTDMLEEVIELKRAATAQEPLILDIHLVAG